jgi:hypothetical protein
MSYKKGGLNTRKLQYGLNSAVLTFTVITIVILINLIADIKPVRLDLTSNKIYSIGDATKSVLEKLSKHVEIIGLFDDGKIDTDYKKIKDLLDQYIKGSNSHISIKYIDPDKSTEIIKQLDPGGVKNLKKNDFVVLSGDKFKKLSYEDLYEVKTNQQTLSQQVSGLLAEQKFTNAIYDVSKDEILSLYFVGEDEDDIIESQYKSLIDALTKKELNVKTLNLPLKNDVPNDAEALIFVSPKKDLSENECSRIKKYLEKGGRAVFLFDTVPHGGFKQFESIINTYNLSLRNDKIKENDDNIHLPNDPYALILDVRQSPVVSEEFSIVFKDSASVRTLKNENGSVNVIPLVKSSNSSINTGRDSADAGTGTAPYDLAIAAEKKNVLSNSRIIVAGSGSFLNEDAKKEYSSYFGNGIYFFTNVVQWAKDDNEEIAVAPKSHDAQMVLIDRFTANCVGVLVIFFIPAIIFGSGLFVWLRRKHL